LINSDLLIAPAGWREEQFPATLRTRLREILSSGVPVGSNKCAGNIEKTAKKQAKRDLLKNVEAWVGEDEERAESGLC
jgi:hypothetical protein